MGGAEYRKSQGAFTWSAPLFVTLFSRPWQLEEREQAEHMPVQVAVGAQLGLLAEWGGPWREGEAQVVAHLCVSRGRGEEGNKSKVLAKGVKGQAKQMSLDSEAKTNVIYVALIHEKN